MCHPDRGGNTQPSCHDGIKGLLGIGTKMPVGWRYVCEAAVKPDERDGHVGDGRQVLGDVLCVGPAAILVEGEIADIVEPVLDLPVGPDMIGDLPGAGLSGGQRGQAVDGFGADLAGLDLFTIAFDAEGLAPAIQGTEAVPCLVGEIDHRTAALFDAAMLLVDVVLDCFGLAPATEAAQLIVHCFLVVLDRRQNVVAPGINDSRCGLLLDMHGVSREDPLSGADPSDKVTQGRDFVAALGNPVLTDDQTGTVFDGGEGDDVRIVRALPGGAAHGLAIDGQGSLTVATRQAIFSKHRIEGIGRHPTQDVVEGGGHRHGEALLLRASEGADGGALVLVEPGGEFGTGGIAPIATEPGGDHDGEVAGQGVALSPGAAKIGHAGKVVMEAAQGPGIGECGRLVTLHGVGGRISAQVLPGLGMQGIHKDLLGLSMVVPAG